MPKGLSVSLGDRAAGAAATFETDRYNVAVAVGNGAGLDRWRFGCSLGSGRVASRLHLGCRRLPDPPGRLPDFVNDLAAGLIGLLGARERHPLEPARKRVELVREDGPRHIELLAIRCERDPLGPKSGSRRHTQGMRGALERRDPRRGSMKGKLPERSA